MLDWESCYRPKEESGVGLRLARTTNRAFLMKLCFCLHSEFNSLWAKLVSGKYLKGDLTLRIQRKAIFLTFGEALLVSLKDTLPALQRVLVNGLEMNFWLDPWIEAELPLISFVEQQTSRLQLDLAVADCCSNGVWRIAALKGLLPSRVIAKIQAIPLVTRDSMMDYWC